MQLRYLGASFLVEAVSGRNTNVPLTNCSVRSVSTYWPECLPHLLLFSMISVTRRQFCFCANIQVPTLHQVTPLRFFMA
jgi:hypothetical protein